MGSPTISRLGLGRLPSFAQLLCNFRAAARVLWSFSDPAAPGALRLLCVCSYGVTVDSLTNGWHMLVDKLSPFLTPGKATRHVFQTVPRDGAAHGRSQLLCVSQRYQRYPFHISSPCSLFLLPVNHLPE